MGVSQRSDVSVRLYDLPASRLIFLWAKMG
jgi:hypothetical protein